MLDKQDCEAHKNYKVNLSRLKPVGEANIEVADNIATIWTTQPISGLGFHLTGNVEKHYVAFPKKYRLPLRIDMTVKLDYPAFVLRVGKGHVYFSSGHDTEYSKFKDFAAPDSKPSKDIFSFDNRLPLGEFVNISIIFNFNEMQVCIGGEERFYSRNQPYMKKKQSDSLSELNAEGFELGLTVTKHSTLSVKAVTILEHGECIPITRGSFELPDPKAPKPEKIKPTFDNVVGKISQEFQAEVKEMDAFFKSLRPMKFKRNLDKSGCKITFVEPNVGISYTVVASGAESYHHFGWYIVYSGPVETWHRKADYMEEILAEICKTDRRLAERVYDALVGCSCGRQGLCRTLYKFDGQKKVTCHGRVYFRMSHDDFNDIRAFFLHLNALIEQKIANGDASPEKIILQKKLSR